MSDQPALILLVQQLQQELQNQRVEIQSLRMDLNASRADVQYLQTQLLSKTPMFKPRLPDPPRFDGKPYTLRTWLPSIRAKLRSDQLTGADAFDYVWDRLEQSQQASILHLRQSAEETQSWDPEVIFSFFQRLCHNPREQQEALQRFSSVRQREDESLIAYLARFERLTYEADATTWPDISRVTTLHRGLRSILRQTLEESNDSLFILSYDEYIELVQSVDRRTRRSQPAQKLPQNLTQNSRTEPMDMDPVQVNALHVPTPTSSFTPSSTRSRSSSPDRRSFRLKNNLCLYCGSQDHWIADCPRPRPTSPAIPVSDKPRLKTTARSPTLSARFASSRRPSA